MSDNKKISTITSTAAAPEQDQQHAVLPAVDVFEDAAGITLLADMPGVPKDQLELKVEDDALLIMGRVKPRTTDGLEASGLLTVRGEKHIDSEATRSRWHSMHLEAPSAWQVTWLR